MMDLATMRYMNGQAVKRSKASGKQPLQLASVEEVDRLFDRDDDSVGPIPFLGDDVLGTDYEKEYGLGERLDDMFCDTTGCGRESEPAMTQRAFAARLKELVVEHGTIYIAITEAGEFQANVAAFAKS